jgi:hypothetical protein
VQTDKEDVLRHPPHVFAGEPLHTFYRANDRTLLDRPEQIGTLRPIHRKTLHTMMYPPARPDPWDPWLVSATFVLLAIGAGIAAAW